MNTAILTFQESSNYGALLQAYAMQTALLKLGTSCEIINYHSKYKEEQYSAKFSSRRSTAANLNIFLSGGLTKRVNRSAAEFKAEYLNITKTVFNNSHSLKEYSSRWDRVICGSDQVWNINSIGYDGVFFLDFLDDPVKMLPYAPSFGISVIPDDNAREFYARHLNRFQRISVREKSGVKIINDLTGKTAEVVLDPTLLLSAGDWDKLRSTERVCKRPYIFLYYVGYSPEIVTVAKELSKRTGFEVVLPAKTIRDYKNGFKAAVMSPRQFVAAIADAEFVLTNSFHGTAFSVNYGKQFVSFGKRKASVSANVRVNDFLKSVCLSDRRYDDDMSIFEQKTDFKEAAAELEKLREASWNYLSERILSYNEQ